MRSTVGVLLVAMGILAGAHGLARWSGGTQPAVALTEIPAVARPVSTVRARRPDSVEAVLLSARSPSPSVGAVAASEPTAAPRPIAATPVAEPPNLARELQRALRHADCYSGAINGMWTPATRRAMQAFLARANAALPVDKPDFVLLALMHSEGDARCGSCPEGQQLGARGACVPKAMRN
jgi:hypothetical protein